MGQKQKSNGAQPSSALPPGADIAASACDVRKVPILLQNSKIEPLRKSRESGVLDALTAAKLCSAATKVRGRFCANRCGPSYIRVRNSSAVLENFGRHLKRTFSTLSATSRHCLKSLNDFVSALLEKLRHLNGVATLLKATPQRSLHLRLVSAGWAKPRRVHNS
jgi:hypothetical protein